MPTRALSLTLVAMLAASFARCVPARKSVSPPRAEQFSSQTAVTAQALPIYPDSTDGLESLMNDMLALTKKGDSAALALYFDSLVLPHWQDWFRSRFGDENCGAQQMAANDCLGSRLAFAYAAIASKLPTTAAATMKDLLDEKLMSFEAVNYSAPCAAPVRIIPIRKLVADLSTTPILSPVLSGLVQHNEPIYVLWAYSDRQETTIAFFVYSEGAFRYIGMPHPASQEEFASKTAPPTPAELTDDELNARPVLANQALAQRTAVLHVLIGTDGTVRDVSYVRGPEAFKDAAIQKVKEKRFQPMSLGGHPVQVSTCVNLTAPK